MNASFSMPLCILLSPSDPITCRTLGEGLRPFLSTSATSLCLAVRTLHWNISWHHHLPGSSWQRESGQHKRSCNLRRVLVYNYFLCILHMLTSHFGILQPQYGMKIRMTRGEQSRVTFVCKFLTKWLQEQGFALSGAHERQLALDLPSRLTSMSLDVQKRCTMAPLALLAPLSPLLHWPFLECGAVRGRMPASSQLRLSVDLFRQMFVRSIPNRALSNQWKTPALCLSSFTWLSKMMPRYHAFKVSDLKHPFCVWSQIPFLCKILSFGTAKICFLQSIWTALQRSMTPKPAATTSPTPISAKTLRNLKQITAKIARWPASVRWLLQALQWSCLSQSTSWSQIPRVLQIECYKTKCRSGWTFTSSRPVLTRSSQTVKWWQRWWKLKGN